MSARAKSVIPRLIELAKERRVDRRCGFTALASEDGGPEVEFSCNKAPHHVGEGHALLDAEGGELLRWEHPTTGGFIIRNAFGGEEPTG